MPAPRRPGPLYLGVAHVLVLPALLLAGGLGPASAAAVAASPVRRVLNMLQAMGAKVEQQLRGQDEAFDKFMCYCKKTDKELDASTASNTEKLPQVQSNVKEAESLVEQLQSDIKEHEASLQSAELAIAEQKQLRERERADFGRAVAETSRSIEATESALKVLREARVADGGSFLQSKALDAVRSLAQRVTTDRLRATDREQLVSLLDQLDRLDGEEGEADSAELQDAGEVVGILEQLKDDMRADLAAARQKDAASEAEGQALMAAKVKEAKSLQTTIEEKHRRLSDTSVDLVQLKGDLAGTRSSLESDAALLKDLREQCAVRREAFEAIKGDLSREQRAIREAAKVLSEDKAREVFQKVEATASFLQVAAVQAPAQKEVVGEAAAVLQSIAAANGGGGKLGLLGQRAARAASSSSRTRRRTQQAHGSGGRGPADSVAKLAGVVDEMVQVLAKDQEDDDLKQQMCKGEFEREQQRKQDLGEQVESKSAEVSAAENQHSQVGRDIEGLRRGIAELDDAVKEATTRRKDDNALYRKTMADINEAIGLLQVAREHLQKYYDAKLVQVKKAERERQRREEALVEASGIGASLLERLGASGAESQEHAASPQNLQKEGDGVIQILTEIEQDLQKEIEQEKAEEDKDQKEYERFIKVSAQKREVDAKSLSARVATLAEISESRRVLKRKRKLLRGELEHTAQVIASLHKECDWLLTHFDERRRKRAAEVEALHRTKAVLQGARPTVNVKPAR